METSTQMHGFSVGDTLQEQKQAATKRKKSRKIPREKSIIREYAETIAIALLVAALLRVFVVSAYHVSSGSMEDGLMAGDYIFVNKLAYMMSEPQNGDVIVFENPFDDNKDYIKRVVATENQTVEMIDKILYIDGLIAPIPPNSKNTDFKILPAVLSNRDNFGPIMVPEGHVFVLGDNRDDSRDSRFWGPVEKKYIKGKSVFVYFSYEPDPNAPEWKFPYIIEFFEILFHNIFTFYDRFRPDRIGASF